MKVRNLILLFGFISLFGCASKDENSRKPIVLGDPSTIITETDSMYLKNLTQDIAPNKTRNSEKKIAQMMVQVDSLNVVKKMDEGNFSESPLSGFTINFNETEVVFNSLYAHALNLNQDERKSNSVSYVKDAGDFLEMKLQVKNLTDVRVEQRLTTKVQVELSGEKLVLHELGKNLTPWYNLVGKNGIFISTGVNSLQFKEFKNDQLKNCLSTALRKKNTNPANVTKWMASIVPTKSYADPPCKVVIVSVQYRIKGNFNGQKIQKLIQFDIPL